MKIKEKVLKEVLSKINRFEKGKEKLYLAYKEDFEKAIDLTLAEVGKVIDDIEVDIDDGFHPIEKYCNSRELKQKLGIK